MECPWCGRQLEAGTFESRGSNYFHPQNSPRPKWYTEKYMEKCKCIMLPPSPHNFSPRLKEEDLLKAFLCRNCKKIIIPY